MRLAGSIQNLFVIIEPLKQQRLTQIKSLRTAKVFKVFVHEQPQSFVSRSPCSLMQSQLQLMPEQIDSSSHSEFRMQNSAQQWWGFKNTCLSFTASSYSTEKRKHRKQSTTAVHCYKSSRNLSLETHMLWIGTKNFFYTGQNFTLSNKIERWWLCKTM